MLFSRKLFNLKRGAITAMLLQLHFDLPLAKGPSFGDYETPSVHVCVRVYICHSFASTFISHSFMKISSSNLQRLLMAENISVKILCSSLKTTWPP